MKPREHGTSSIRGYKTLYFMVRITMVIMLGVMNTDNS